VSTASDEPAVPAPTVETARRPRPALLAAGWASVVLVPFAAPVIGLLLWWRYRGSSAGLWITAASLAVLLCAILVRLLSSA